MNQQQVKELKKKRAEYIEDIVAFRLLSGMAFIAAVACGMFAVFGRITHVFDECGFAPCPPDTHLMEHVWIFLICAPVAYGAARLSARYGRLAKEVPFVPTVREQVASLSAEQILVRGSDAPSGLPGELLRATYKGTETR